MTEAMSNHEEAVRGKNETLCRNVWDTSYVSKADSFGYFREGICQSFLALTPERPLGRVFKARVEKTNLQGGWIGRIDVTPHLVRRTVSDKSTLPGDYMHLCMKLIGSSRIDVDGKVFKQRMGDAVLMDVASIKSFDLEPGKRTRSVNVIFEKSDSEIVGLLDGKPHVLFSETSFESPLKLCLYTIENRYNLASELELRCLFDASLSLLKAALHKDREYLEDKCANSYETRMGLLSVIKRYIRDELSDPGLSVNKVATKFGISGRYVHVLFQDEKNTFKDYITDLRLKQVRADLFDASKKNVTAIDIASRWGFQDKTTFHRNFKAYFGETPARLRAAALQAPGSDDF